MNMDSETAPFRKWILRWWSVLALFRYNLSISEKKKKVRRQNTFGPLAFSFTQPAQPMATESRIQLNL